MSMPKIPPPTVDRLQPWTHHSARILHIKQEIQDTFTLQIEFEDPEVAEGYRFAPGQFNMLYLPGIGESAISISSDPETPQTLSHTIRKVGNVTKALYRKQVGDQVLVRGPFGSSWPVQDCQNCDVILASGGVGLAPMRPILYYIMNHRQDYGEVSLLYGARTPQVLLYADEYQSWQDRGINLQVTVDLGDDTWQGNLGVVPLLFYRLRINAPLTRIMTCGPEIMMRFVIFEALARRLKPDDIYLSMERNMNCALGFCGHCQLGPAFVCNNGPVFTYKYMEPYFDVEDL